MTIQMNHVHLGAGGDRAGAALRLAAGKAARC